MHQHHAASYTQHSYFRVQLQCCMTLRVLLLSGEQDVIASAYKFNCLLVGGYLGSFWVLICYKKICSSAAFTLWEKKYSEQIVIFQMSKSFMKILNFLKSVVLLFLPFSVTSIWIHLALHIPRDQASPGGFYYVPYN